MTLIYKLLVRLCFCGGYKSNRARLKSQKLSQRTFKQVFEIGLFNSKIGFWFSKSVFLITKMVVHGDMTVTSVFNIEMRILEKVVSAMSAFFGESAFLSQKRGDTKSAFLRCK